MFDELCTLAALEAVQMLLGKDPVIFGIDGLRILIRDAVVHAVAR